MSSGEVRTFKSSGARDRFERVAQAVKHGWKPGYADPGHSHPFSFDPDSAKCLICGAAKKEHKIK